jgi:hypothetical protein
MNCKTCQQELTTQVYVVVPQVDNMKLCLLCWGHFQDEYFNITNQSN